MTAEPPPTDTAWLRSEEIRPEPPGPIRTAIRRLLRWLARPCTCHGCEVGDTCELTVW